MVRRSTGALSAAALVAVCAGAAVAADWTKTTLKMGLDAAKEKVKDKGEAKLERINITGLKEDGTIDVSAVGSTIQVVFKAGDKSWTVSMSGIGQPDPYVGVTEYPVPNTVALPDGFESKLKDSADYAKAAKAEGISFPATLTIYAVDASKVWCVVTDGAGKTVILDPVTAAKTQ